MKKFLLVWAKVFCGAMVFLLPWPLFDWLSTFANPLVGVTLFFLWITGIFAWIWTR